MATEKQMETLVEPAAHFMVWAKENGFTLGTWDGDGQMREVDDRDVLVKYALALPVNK